MSFARLLARLWSVNDPYPEQVDLIIAVAHGATATRLTRGAKAVAYRTANAMKHDRGKWGIPPYLLFGSFSGSKNPEVERQIKSRIFDDTGRYIGPVVSTIEECMKIRDSLPIYWTTPESIVVVTDEAHSRRCRIVWKTFFPKSKISIISVRISETVDKESPMLPYRLGEWATLMFQVLPTPYFWLMSLFGPKFMERQATKLHQPIAK